MTGELTVCAITLSTLSPLRRISIQDAATCLEPGTIGGTVTDVDDAIARSARLNLKISITGEGSRVPAVFRPGKNMCSEMMPFCNWPHPRRRGWITVSLLQSPKKTVGVAGRVTGNSAFRTLACSLALSLGRVYAQSPTNIFAPAATPAHSIFDLSMLVLSVTLVIFLVVGGLLLYALIRYRHRPENADREPAQIYGSNQIELSWTVIPILIVLVLFLATTRVIMGTQSIPEPASAMNVTVIGHQFWWEYRYPKLGVVTANELHIPTSNPAQPTPTYLTMTSADVAHSFWVPRLAGKTDVIPNKINTMWIDPAERGIYLGQCAQYCGTQHAKMLLRVYVQSPADFVAWINKQKQPAVRDFAGNDAAEQGQSVFMHNACINCHTVSGTVATGRFGPDLTHLASRDTIAAGAIQNTPENLRDWIDNPNSMKPGSLMPAMHLNGHDLDLITAYLTQLR